MSLSPQTERLIQDIQSGDESAFAELHARYLPRLERLVRVRLGAALRQRLEAEDILQEVFLRVLRGIDHFEARSDARFVDWLATLVLNQIRKEAEHWGAQRRDPAREERVQRSPTGYSSRVLTSPSTGPVTRAVRNEHSRVLENALDDMNEPYREVLILRHMTGMSFAEIADHLQRPSEAAARELYRRARARLAIVLEEHGLHPPGSE